LRHGADSWSSRRMVTSGGPRRGREEPARWLRERKRRGVQAWAAATATAQGKVAQGGGDARRAQGRSAGQRQLRHELVFHILTRVPAF
jgi:hypothetical protein